ncbi:MAG: 1-deoxy-D-xylulose-5-phosphate synthase [Bacteroidota bacterium]
MPLERIMYIEQKNGDGGLIGNARIGKVRFSKSRQSIHYQGKTFQTLSGAGFKANYFDVETGDHYWISGCKKNGEDRLYGERLPIQIDADIQETYWSEIRNLPSMVGKLVINGK